MIYQMLDLHPVCETAIFLALTIIINQLSCIHYIHFELSPKQLLEVYIGNIHKKKKKDKKKYPQKITVMDFLPSVNVSVAGSSI